MGRRAHNGGTMGARTRPLHPIPFGRVADACARNFMRASHGQPGSPRHCFLFMQCGLLCKDRACCAVRQALMAAALLLPLYYVCLHPTTTDTIHHHLHHPPYIATATAEHCAPCTHPPACAPTPPAPLPAERQDHQQGGHRGAVGREARRVHPLGHRGGDQGRLRPGQHHHLSLLQWRGGGGGGGGCGGSGAGQHQGRHQEQQQIAAAMA